MMNFLIYFETSINYLLKEIKHSSPKNSQKGKKHDTKKPQFYTLQAPLSLAHQSDRN